MMKSLVDKNRHNRAINANRKDVLASAWKALSRKNFQMNSSIMIQFSGEIGIDTGGLSREFYRLCLRQIHGLSVFHGPDGCKTLVLVQSCELLSKCKMVHIYRVCQKKDILNIHIKSERIIIFFYKNFAR